MDKYQGEFFANNEKSLETQEYHTETIKNWKLSWENPITQDSSNGSS